jgi:hypothetical protein
MSVAGMAAAAWAYGFFAWMLLAEVVIIGGLVLLLRSMIDRRPLPPAP